MTKMSLFLRKKLEATAKELEDNLRNMVADKKEAEVRLADLEDSIPKAEEYIEEIRNLLSDDE